MLDSTRGEQPEQPCSGADKHKLQLLVAALPAIVDEVGDCVRVGWHRLCIIFSDVLLLLALPVHAAAECR